MQATSRTVMNTNTLPCMFKAVSIKAWQTGEGAADPVGSPFPTPTFYTQT